MAHVRIAKWRDNPAIARLVRATFPQYRKQAVYVYPHGSVTITDLGWSGGTRAEYRWSSLGGGIVTVPPHVREGDTVPISQGDVVVQGGTFCGQAATLHIYVNPADRKVLGIDDLFTEA